MSSEAQNNARSSQKITNMDAGAETISTGMSTQAQKKAADVSAAAAVAVGQRNANAKIQGALFDGISGIASGGISAIGRANNMGKYASNYQRG